MSLFGVFFTGNSFPITDAVFKRTDETHWVLDVGVMVNPDYYSLKEVALFLTAPGVLAPNLALALYVSVGGAEWSYRGCVSSTHPTEVLPLQWPQREDGPPVAAVVGVSVEPLEEVAAKEGSKLGAKEEFAKRVAYDLFRFVESFAGSPAQPGTDMIAVPSNVLDRWFSRLSERLRRDPDFLTRAGEKA